MSHDTEQAFRSEMEWNLINEASTKFIDPAVNIDTINERRQWYSKKHSRTFQGRLILISGRAVKTIGYEFQ